jgi:hypothetical protein
LLQFTNPRWVRWLWPPNNISFATATAADWLSAAAANPEAIPFHVAPLHADQTGPNPTDRAKRGSKRRLICDGRGMPLAVRLTGANRNDSQEALALKDAILPCTAPADDRGSGRTACSQDCGYDAAAIRRGLRTRHIVPLLAMRRAAHGSGLGR